MGIFSFPNGQRQNTAIFSVDNVDNVKEMISDLALEDLQYAKYGSTFSSVSEFDFNISHSRKLCCVCRES